jgi:hypothetical protein
LNGSCQMLEPTIQIKQYFRHNISICLKGFLVFLNASQTVSLEVSGKFQICRSDLENSGFF